MKFAFFVLPHLGGTFSVFLQLRATLARHGIELIWIGSVNRLELEENASLAPLLDCGVPIAPTEDTRQAAQAWAIAEAISAVHCDGVMVNVLSDRVSTNLVRYLPASLLRIMIVHNMTPGTYAAARAIRDHVHATVCVSQRAKDDLLNHYGFDQSRIHVIENAVTLHEQSMRSERRSEQDTLRVLYLGRIEDASKGVLWLPRIFDNVTQPVSLTVAGDGPDMDRLRRSLATKPYQVTFLGALPSSKVPQVLADHDALIMPSRYEGLPMSLIEGMSAGCIPVASYIRGVTDTIIDDRRDGLLFPVGDCQAAARCLDTLAANPVWCDGLSASAIEKARSHYRADRMGADYARLIFTLRANPPRIRPSLSLAGWRFPLGLRPGLRTYLPTPIKNTLRRIRART
ncbi:glycosyltransferase family 4 protein [Qingshengfaniella alkalisoli]|uniref:glycosyltransferase family 4 protein n=1 Tax=Qingshengfaniella alkalisoli TaxID=2599296 RepID=UPI00143CD8CF|nr:glycosyltransferase family 4 protein [Qingshengfaniella alkalisoli]